MAFDLNLELTWYGVRQQVRRFPAGATILGALEDDGPGMPMWGFALTGPMVLARPDGDGYRLTLPPGAEAERSTRGDRLHRVRGQGSVTLGPTDRVRFVCGPSALTVSLLPRAGALAPRRLSRGLALTLGLFAVFFTGLSAFAYAVPPLDVALEAPSWGTQERLARLLPHGPYWVHWRLNPEVRPSRPRRVDLLPCRHGLPRAPSQFAVRGLTVRGASDRRAILQVLEAHRDELLTTLVGDDRCRARPSGTVTLQWRIWRTGAARDVTVNGTTMSWTNAGAIAVRLSSWRFPEPAGLDEKVSATLFFNLPP